MSPMADNTLVAPVRRARLTPFRAGLFWQTLMLVLLMLILLGPVLNLLIWSVAESWYFPHALPAQWGMKYWSQVFSPYSDVSGSLLTSIGVALLTVAVCLAVAVPAGYALSRRGMPLRFFFMLLFLIPQAFPGLTVYMNVARLFYQWGLNGTVTGVVLVHSVHGMMYAIWISVAAFSSVDPLLARAARNLGASATYTFFRIVLPQAAPALGPVLSPPVFLCFWNRWMSLPARFSSARRISARCRCCSITPACPATTRSHPLPR